ncbi:hypothetical protein CARUB_v10015760mg [Capsella rubella]|uniref:Major facilitator superfamily (MFS) profile domain-containing protein n=1 Tax=Capsella rubella TaxID=81985 RepID=R0GA93_9BRAS|nr:hypothetical protein CARUB_v10015760mg [Capsella rubella]
MAEYGELRHILTTVFLSGFAEFLLRPVMTDVTVAAVCSGLNSTCSLAVYLTGIEQVTVGLGTMVMMPVIGNFADRYGIKALLTVPMCLSILPPAILGYRRDTNFFYAFYITKILFDMAKNVHVRKRISTFGVLAGVRSISAVCATFSTRFLPIASTFQVSAISFFAGLVYMRIFLKERLHDDDGDYDEYNGGGNHHHEVRDRGNLKMLGEPILRDAPTNTPVYSTTTYSTLQDMVSLLKNSTILVQTLVVTFFATFAQSGMQSAFLYFLKARFGFNKNDFAELILLITIIGSISQLFILPILVSSIGERRVLSTGLLMETFNAACLSVSWSAWVPYATTVLVPVAMFVMPSVCGIASRQGKVQGYISGVKSFSGVVAPLIYSPLTALFLSENAPFYFPGFSILCVALSLLIGFLMSLLIKDVPSTSMNKASITIEKEEA